MVFQVNNMTDDLKKLQNAFDREPPVKADAGAKNAAMNAAMAAFDEENSKARQGSLIEPRLKQQGNKLFDLFTFSYWRKSMKLSYALAGGTSIAVLTVAVINTGQFKELTQPRFSQIGQTLEAITPVKKEPQPKTELDLQDRVASETNTTILQKKNPTNRAKVKQATRAPASQSPVLQGLVGTAPLQPRLERKAIVAPSPKRRQVGGRKPDSSKISGLYADPGPEPVMPPRIGEQNRDKFEEITPNPLKQTAIEPVSTFSIDVDTASYSFMRASINRGVLPPKDAVRVEELINYFPYDYQGPASKDVPFKANVTVMPTPWNTSTKLVHIGIKGYELAQQQKPRSNLVFLLDTSGSMNAPNKLPLLKNSFKLLLSSLGPDDTVSIVAYAGSAGTVLEPTKASDKNKIFAALDRLRAGGSTAGGEGIRLAYQLAESNFDKKGINRIILATDGDFNVGIRDRRQLKSFIERKRKSGVFLSILGFGMGNYNDALMQTLAQNGNGNASYIDSLSEARKVLVQEASSTLFTIAKDVKIQMEFNPQTVSAYRLIGYETRILNREDFNNDKVDAGEIGAGHTVTAIYEITPVNADSKLVDPLRYKKLKLAKTDPGLAEYGFLKLRYKLPNESKSRLIETPVKLESTLTELAQAPQDVRFATAVAAYGQLLRGGKFTGSYSYNDVIKLALSAKGDDPYGYRSEFINLVRLADTAAAMKPTGN